MGGSKWVEKDFYWRATQETDKIISKTLSETFVNIKGPAY